MLRQCSAPGNISSCLQPFTEMTIQRLNQSLSIHWRSVQTHGVIQENVISEFLNFSFLSFSLNLHAAFLSSFLLFSSLLFLAQSCSWASLFRKNQSGVNECSFSYRVRGDYWAPEVHLVPLDNLYVWTVLYLQFPEERWKSTGNCLCLYCLLQGIAGVDGPSGPKGNMVSKKAGS